MSEFVLLTDFPNKAKAIGPYYDSVSFYSLEEGTYLTYDEVIDNFEIVSNDDGDSECAFGKVLFSVSRIDDNGNVIKCNEDTFFDKMKSDGIVLDGYSFDDPDRLIGIFSTLKDRAITELCATVSRNGCDALYPTFIHYFINEEHGIIGYQIGGTAYVLNSTPDFKKYPWFVKISNS